MLMQSARPLGELLGMDSATRSDLQQREVIF